MSVRLTLTVKPGSKAPGFERADDGYVLRVRERAVEGMANAGCVRALAEYLNLRQGQITLVRGERSRVKTFAIEGVTETDFRMRLERAEGTGHTRANADGR